MALLAEEAAAIAAWPGLAPLCFTRSRGDGWQVRLSDPRLGLRAVLSLWTRLRAAAPDLRSRFSLGQGQVRLNGPDLSGASGSALVVSGDGLDRMGPQTDLVIAGEGVTPLHQAVLALAGAQLARLSAPGAEALHSVLPPAAQPQRLLAARIGTSPQAFGQRLRAADWPALQSALHGWEAPPQ